MLAVARRRAEAAGARNVQFVAGATGPANDAADDPHPVNSGRPWDSSREPRAGRESVPKTPAARGRNLGSGESDFVCVDDGLYAVAEVEFL
jgi:hypothetical protein